MGKRKGRLSAGSVLMLALTVLVLLGSALVLLRLKSGTVRPVVRTDVEALTGIGGRETEPEAESAEAPRTEQSAPPGQAAAREPAAQPTAGISLELDIVAACIIGGCAPSGGRGTMMGTVIGTLLISFLRNGLTLLDISTNVQLVVIGLIIIVAVTADQIATRRKAT